MILLSSFVLVLLSVSFFAGCSEDTAPNYTVQNVFPLKEYNSWSYYYYKFNSDGSRSDEGYANITIGDTTTYNGMPVFETDMAGDIGVDGVMYYNDTEVRNSDTQDSLIVKYPMEVNQPLVVYNIAYGQTTRTTYLVLKSDNEKVTVRAGTFNTLHYDRIKVKKVTSIAGTTIDSTVSSSYYCFNIGLVKQQNYDNGILASEYDLYNYKVK